MTALTGGTISLAAILLFAGLSILALANFGGASAAPSTILTPYTWAVLRFTLVQATLSTVLSLAFAIPVARALARQRHFPGRLWLIRLMAVPMGLPVLIGALGLIGIWGRKGILNDGLTILGVATPVSIYGLFGILLAHVFFNMPLACRLLLIGLERVPSEYWQVATSLGMHPASIFRFIEWPVIRRLVPGIAGLIFMLCATSFTLVLTLGGGPAATTIEVAIYQALRFDFDPQRAVGLSLLQIVLTAIILGIMAALPTPVDHSMTAGKPVRRMDGEPWMARLTDTLTLFAAMALLLPPLAAVTVYGLRADLPRLVTEAVFLKASATSLALSLISGFICVTLAYLIIVAQNVVVETRKESLGSRVLSIALAASSSLVLLVPPVVIATGWFLLLLPTGDVSRFAPFLVIGINALMALPFVTRILGPAYDLHRQRTGRLTTSLGLSGFARWRFVEWPGLRRPLAMAMSFAMALSLGDLGAVALFGSDSLVTLPWLLYSRMGSYRTTDADGLALLLGVVCLALTIAGTAGNRDMREAGDDRP